MLFSRALPKSFASRFAKVRSPGPTQRKYRFNHWSMNCMCTADFWLERLPQLLDLSATMEALFTATAEPDYLI